MDLALKNFIGVFCARCRLDHGAGAVACFMDVQQFCCSL